MSWVGPDGLWPAGSLARTLFRVRSRLAVALAAVTALVAPAVAWTTAAPKTQVSVAAAALGTVSFNAVGDFGSGSNAQATFAGLGSRPGDLTVALGDFSYSTSLNESQWCDLVHAGVPEGYPFELVSGNHESNGQHGYIDSYATCLPNQLPGLRGTYGRQWWVDQPAAQPLVRFVAVSPGIPFVEGNLDYSAGSPRYQWTAAAIDGARAAGIAWVVVAMHVPCLSVGNYACTGVEDLTNLFVQKRVDLVLSGHEHLYQRTHQIGTGAGCATIAPGGFNAACVVDSDSAYGKGRGTVFATVGTGGVESRAANLTDPERPWFSAISASNQTPAFGFLAVTATDTRMEAEFVRNNLGPFTDTFSIDATPQTPNDPPVASATVNCSQLACTLDGSASSDPDGTVVAHAWVFGDATTGTGATTTHTYAAAGTYTVTLTVTDDDGATATTSRTITVTAPPNPTSLAADTFSRTVASGWGTADVGGAWSASVPTGSSASVTGTRGLAAVAAGRTLTMSLPPLGTRTDMALRWSTDKVPTGSGFYVSALVRRVAGQGDYRAKVRHAAAGAIGVSLTRLSSAGAETVLASELTVPALTLAANEALAVRVRSVGVSPTTLQVRVWKVGTPEPSTWLRTASDTTTGLQVSGGVGLSGYLSSSATNAPITLAVDDLDVMAVP